MNTHIIYLIIGAVMLPFTAGAATTCSRANLTRCLDSVCAININANPAARCQYCGTANAGTPDTSKTMQNLTLGQSAKYIIDARELKSAPGDPGQRYVWATTKCIEKVDNCTTDDVSDVYDKMIEQSCRAAGINAQMASLRATAAKPANRNDCSTDIGTCLVGETRCGPDYHACQNDADFDKFFAACSVDAMGCDEFISDIRAELITARDNAIQNADALVKSIVLAHQSDRAQRQNAPQADCQDNAARNKCVASVCNNNMTYHCGNDVAPEQLDALKKIIQDEQSMALQLCKFYDTACGTLK